MLHGGDPPPPAVQQRKRGWSKQGCAVNIKHTDFRYSVPKKKDETSKNVYIGSIHSERLKDDSLGMLSKTRLFRLFFNAATRTFRLLYGSHSHLVLSLTDSALSWSWNGI